jgi:hypothetical protein
VGARRSWALVGAECGALPDRIFGPPSSPAPGRTELNVLQKLHHPHCVQFFGAVTKTSPYMM